MPRPHRHTCGQRLFALCPLTCVPAQSLSLLQTLRGNLLFSVALLRPPLTDFQWVPVTYSGRAQLLGFPLQVLPLSALTALSYPVFLHGLTHARGSCLRETPPVCSALCHHHVLPLLPPEPHSVERLWGPRTTAGTGRAQSQPGTGWWGGLLTSFWSAHVCIFFSSWAPSPNLRAQLSLLSASRASLRSCVPLATFCGAKSYSVYASRLVGTITRSLGLG